MRLLLYLLLLPTRPAGTIVVPVLAVNPHQQSAPIRAMQEEQHTGPNAAQTDKQPISEQEPLLQEGPCRFVPHPRDSHTCKAGAGAQPQICTIPGPGTPTACPHIGLHAGSQNHHPTCLPALGRAGMLEGRGRSVRCAPPPGSHACVPPGWDARLSASFSRKNNRRR